MKTAWALQDGWERLQKQINDGTIYAIFTGHQIPDNEVVDVAITLIIQTGLFSTQYKQWHERADGQKTWTHFKDFWKAKIEL